MLLFWQDYIRDLEKEEEEQKKIQKVESIQKINFVSPMICSYLVLNEI